MFGKGHIVFPDPFTKKKEDEVGPGFYPAATASLVVFTALFYVTPTVVLLVKTEL